MRIGVVGATGRMGQAVLTQLLARHHTIAGAVTQKGDKAIGRDVGLLLCQEPVGVTVSDDAEALFASAQAVIDFTRPQPTVYYAGLAAKHGVALISGTTGLDAEQELAIQKAAASAPVMWAPNMSLGVNLLMALTEKAASLLGPDYDIEIVEMHHRHKVDAPSGTALGLGRAAAKGRKVKLDEVAEYTRHGHTGVREAGTIGFATLRGGDVIGDHTVVFASEGERVELTHKASSRDIFARGAVVAAEWAVGKKPGFYTMKDVLGL